MKTEDEKLPRKGLTSVVHVRVTPAEKKRLEQYAESQNATISELVRAFIQSLPLEPPADRECSLLPHEARVPKRQMTAGDLR